MYCTHCGTPHPPEALACPSCGRPVPRFAPAVPVKNHLPAAVLVTLCCCMPFGIVALVFSAQVNSKLAVGDVAGALAASNRAWTWTLVALIAGLLTFGGAALISLIG